MPNQEDSVLPDAPANGIDVNSGDGESSDLDDPPVHPTDGVRNPALMDVKLEDLFKDEDEDDDEFPSSVPTSGNIPSSPPAAPV